MGGSTSFLFGIVELWINFITRVWFHGYIFMVAQVTALEPE